MKIGVFTPRHLPQSVRAYLENVARELETLDVRLIRFSERDALPAEVDLYWDPRAAGGCAPYRGLKGVSKPYIVTVHGAGPLALPAMEVFPNPAYAILGKMVNLRNKLQWRAFSEKYFAIITVSDYAKTELTKHLKLMDGKVFPIHHGVDHALFKPLAPSDTPEPYLLHVSSYRPKKNVERLFSAYARLPKDIAPQMTAVVPGYPQRRKTEGIRLIRTPLKHEELVPLYQRAIGFIFPSLHETFGMPIVEAMACGCPVLTSGETACREVAGGAALLVDPRSVSEIADGMCRLITDTKLRAALSEESIRRARAFTWRSSALGHLAVFQTAVGEG